MNYFELLGLSREPFSNAPDPSFFFSSKNHARCLRELATAIKHGEKICLCLGEVGSGKSTLCRALIQLLNAQEGCETQLVLDPSFAGKGDFLAFLYSRLVGVSPPAGSNNEALLKELVGRLALPGQTRIVLAVDEGQKLSTDCLGVLVQLLEADAAHGGRIQAVIFAQEEFSAILEHMPALRQKSGTTCRLTSLGFLETRSLIRHRLHLAGAKRGIFTWPAHWAVYRATGGRPRKIMHLGHQVLMSLIVGNRARATRSIVMAAALGLEGRPQPSTAAGRNALVVALLCAMLLFPAHLDIAGKRGDVSGPASNLPSEHRGLISTAPHLRIDPGPVSPPPPARIGRLELPAEPDVEAAPDAPDVGDTVQRISPGTTYYVQVGAFQVQRYAEQYLVQAREVFKEADLMQIEYQGAPWFIVYLESFEHPHPARELARQVRQVRSREAVVVQMAKGRYGVVQE